jgi:cellulose 1,4-beta-cellobiosidase
MVRTRSVLRIAVAALSACAATVAAGLAGTPSAAAATQTLCSSAPARVFGGAYIVQTDEWNSSAPECLRLPGGNAFWVSRSAIAVPTDGAPGAYASEYSGCHWGQCSSGGLAARPVRVSSLGTGTAVSSWSTAQPYRAGDAYDVAYDIWLSRSSRSGSSSNGNGSEIMIWLNHRGGIGPAGHEVARGVWIGNHDYTVWYSPPSSPGGGNTISYVMATGNTSVSRLDLGRVIRDSVSRGYTRPWWYLIDVEAGFELWHGGTGLATRSFSVSVK